MKYLMFETEKREIVVIKTESCNISGDITITLNDDIGVRKLFDFFEVGEGKYIKNLLKVIDYHDMMVHVLYDCTIVEIKYEERHLDVTFSYDYIEDHTSIDNYFEEIKSYNRDRKLLSIGI